MVISHITGGIGNQLFQYATGFRLAHKHNTELKMDLSWFDYIKFRPYALNLFNTTAKLAPPEEINNTKKICKETKLGIEKKDGWTFMPEVLNYPDNVYLVGGWENEKYFADIADIIRQEFTLKNPIGETAQHWKEKILAAECSVSLHIRHGDFISTPAPIHLQHPSFTILPLDYYYESLNQLKQQYPNLTVFIFSNNLQWVKENLRLDVPMEFVHGENLTDVEELHLMSLCKHNIIANSTFSWWGAWLNPNPDKKVFMPIPSDDAAKIGYRFSAERDENSPLDSDKWIRVPFDLNKKPDVKMCPMFSLLLVVNNDIATLPETLGTILKQDYKFYEVIIIDNASFDGSGKLCQQAAKFSDKVTLIKLYEKISDGAAWNMAFNAAQGNYVMFLKGNDRLVGNALTVVCLKNVAIEADVVNSAVWLREDVNGNISQAGKKFVLDGDALFRNLKGMLRQKFDKQTVLKILASNANFVPIASKVFKRKFLSDNAIRFDEKISDNDAKILFTTEAMLRTDDEMLFLPNVFYVAPQIV